MRQDIAADESHGVTVSPSLAALVTFEHAILDDFCALHPVPFELRHDGHRVRTRLERGQLHIL